MAIKIAFIGDILHYPAPPARAGVLNFPAGQNRPVTRKNHR